MLSDNNPGDFSQKEEVWRRMGYHPFEVSHGQWFEIPGVEHLKVEGLRSYHNTESLGYGFVTVKKKLKSKYLKAGKDVIIAAKKAGEEISDLVEIPEIAFYCDSTIENLLLHEEWKKYPVILCECTGYPGKHDPAIMKERSHTHLQDLLPVMKKHKDKQWVLLHASCAMEEQELELHEKQLRDIEGINVRILRSSWT